MTDRRLADAAHRATTERVHWEGDCLISERTPAHDYARINVGSGHGYAHRVVWIAKHGPIPDDLTIDHVCLNKKCVNVDHLRLLTRVENGALGATKPTCLNGHDWTDAYIRPYDGARICRLCQSARNRRYYLARIAL